MRVKDVYMHSHSEYDYVLLLTVFHCPESVHVSASMQLQVFLVFHFHSHECSQAGKVSLI